MKNNIQLTTFLLWGFLAFFVYSPLSYAQENLVLNPSFEDVHLDSLSCTYYQSNTRFNSAIEYWTNPTKATSDLYHMSLDDICTMYPFDVLNPAAVQPRTGDAMVGLVLYTEELSDAIEPLEYKEYVQGQLRSPLIQGVTYLVQFYVMMGKRSVYSINNIGFKFLEEPYFQNNQSMIQLTPDFNYLAVIELNEEWTLIEFEYKAPTSGLQYFIIGNFFNANENNIQHHVIYSRDTSAYYVFDDVAVIAPLPSFDPLGPFCRNTIFTLPELSKEGYTGTWYPQVNNQETTTYTFIPDHSTTLQTTLTVEIIPSIDELHFDLETTYCKGAEFSLPSISKEGIEGTWTPAINAQETTTYTFHPLLDDPCLKPKTVTIEITPPTMDLHFDLDTTVCKGVNFTLPNVSREGIEGSWTPEINTEQTTTYTFHPAEDNPCLKPFTVEIEFYPLQSFSLIDYCYKGQVRVEALLPSKDNYSVFAWSINDHSIADTSTVINLSNYTDLLYSGTTRIEATIADENGCLSKANIELDDIQQFCFIPKGISPNGDGLNDFFDLHTFGGVSIQIFNRQGMKVYENAHYTNQWEGQTNTGVALPSGTYFYQFTTSIGEQLSGWVEVMR